MAINKHKSLGRGLGSIISAGAKKIEPVVSQKPVVKEPTPVSDKVSNTLFTEIDITKIIPSPYQARTEFNDEDIKSLAESISSEGLLQPILVRKLQDSTFELLAGERRYRACKSLSMKKILACVQEASNASAAAKGLIENLQRSDLNPMEAAKGILNMMENFNLTQDALSQRLGKSRSSIANSLRLLKLPSEVQGYIIKNLISLGHAKVILGIDDPVAQTIIARKVIENDLNVRKTEDAIRLLKTSDNKLTESKIPSPIAENAVVRDIQNKISSKLNAIVELKHSNKKGKIVIEYKGNDDLQRILDIIGIKL